MQALKKTAVELLALGALSVVLALGANAVRKTGSIKVTRNYFPKAVEAPSPPTTSAVTPKPKKLEHEYQEIDFAELVKVFNDPATAQGLNVLVDARKDDDYAEGHIPGATHCYPYEGGPCVQAVVDQASGAERVIVYCGGGDCEDSIYLCRELVAAGVPEDLLLLYPGGWTEWSGKEMPVEQGQAEP